MRRGEPSTHALRNAAVIAVDELLAGPGNLTRHHAFGIVAVNLNVHPHTVRNWWRDAHPATPLTGDERDRLAAAEALAATLTRLNQTLAATVADMTGPLSEQAQQVTGHG